MFYFLYKKIISILITFHFLLNKKSLLILLVALFLILTFSFLLCKKEIAEYSNEF
jgi:hypothetical protein